MTMDDVVNGWPQVTPKPAIPHSLAFIASILLGIAAMGWAISGWFYDQLVERMQR